MLTKSRTATLTVLAAAILAAAMTATALCNREGAPDRATTGEQQVKEAVWEEARRNVQATLYPDAPRTPPRKPGSAPPCPEEAKRDNEKNCSGDGDINPAPEQPQPP